MSTERPTPETDAYLIEMGDSAYCDFSGERHIDTSFARKLERERDEAREKLEAMRSAIKETSDSFASLINLPLVHDLAARNSAAFACWTAATSALANLKPSLKP